MGCAETELHWPSLHAIATQYIMYSTMSNNPTLLSNRRCFISVITAAGFACIDRLSQHIQKACSLDTIRLCHTLCQPYTCYDAGHPEQAMQSAAAQPEAGSAPASVAPSLRRRQSWTYADNRQTPAETEEEDRMPAGQCFSRCWFRV